MSRRLVIAALALVLAVNVWVLAGVGWNRLGEPVAELTLTERELAMPYTRWPRGENSGIALRLVRPDQDYHWLDRDKLFELGFDPDRYRSVERWLWEPVERPAWIVLEYDGPAFRALVDEQREGLAQRRAGLATGEFNEREIENARQRLADLQHSASRLVAVDAGLNRGPLVDRHGGSPKHVVVRGKLRMHGLRQPGSDETAIRARVSELLPSRVHVPRRFHAELAEAVADRRVDPDQRPRYRVTLRYGRRALPWLAGLEAMPAGDGDSG